MLKMKLAKCDAKPTSRVRDWADGFVEMEKLATSTEYVDDACLVHNVCDDPPLTKNKKRSHTCNETFQSIMTKLFTGKAIYVGPLLKRWKRLVLFSLMTPCWLTLVGPPDSQHAEPNSYLDFVWPHTHHCLLFVAIWKLQQRLNFRFILPVLEVSFITSFGIHGNL